MLKSSDRVVHDLELLQATSPQTSTIASASASSDSAGICSATLVLRKWYDLRPEREWRCFVRSHRLVAVCQRDPTQHFPQLCRSLGVRVEEEHHQGEANSAPPHPAEVAAGEAAQAACRTLCAFHATRIRSIFPLQHCE